MRCWPIGLILVLTWAAYLNTFHVPFVFDDLASIVENPTLSRFMDSFHTPNEYGVTVAGRPVLNVSLAVSYAISGMEPWGYHLSNLVIHSAAALFLYGAIRRTLNRAPMAASLRARSTEIAGATALLWAVHPLQTESVTYVIQRAESLMGMFFLLTFYAVARSIDSPRPVLWQGLAVIACILSAGTKEVAATAPLLVLFYDRAFAAGTFREALRQRWGLYLGLLLSWGWLWILNASTGVSRGGMFTFSWPIASRYWASQTEAIVHYLRLSFWPHPLVFEYGLPRMPEGWRLPIFALFVTFLVVATLIALWKTPRVGFLGAWFLAILSPTSLIPGTLQWTVEHRMYLSLAAVLVASVCWIASKAGRAGLVVLFLIAPVAAVATARRNNDYRDDLTLWGRTLEDAPESSIAHGNMATALFNRGRSEEALVHYEEAARLDPTPPNVHYNLGLAYARAGRVNDALKEYEICARLNPRHYPAYYKAGELLRNEGRRAEAEAKFKAALEQKPDLANAYQELGFLANQGGDEAKAIAYFQQAVALKPQLIDSQLNLGLLLAMSGKVHEALPYLEGAVKLAPETAPPHGNLANVLVELDRVNEAVEHYQIALRLDPKNPLTHYNYANALLRLQRLSEAQEQFNVTAQLDPSQTAAAERAEQLRAYLADQGK